jgi:hypothetical protein
MDGKEALEEKGQQNRKKAVDPKNGLGMRLFA